VDEVEVTYEICGSIINEPINGHRVTSFLHVDKASLVYVYDKQGQIVEGISYRIAHRIRRARRVEVEPMDRAAQAVEAIDRLADWLRANTPQLPVPDGEPTEWPPEIVADKVIWLLERSREGMSATLKLLTTKLKPLLDQIAQEIVAEETPGQCQQTLLTPRGRLRCVLEAGHDREHITANRGGTREAED